MQKRVLSLLLILCLSLGLLPAGALAAGTQTVKTAVTVDYGAAIEAVEYLNQLRREAGLHDLVMDENLVKSAITRAVNVPSITATPGPLAKATPPPVLRTADTKAAFTAKTSSGEPPRSLPSGPSRPGEILPPTTPI